MEKAFWAVVTKTGKQAETQTTTKSTKKIDYYNVLGVDKQASEQQIRDAYKERLGSDLEFRARDRFTLGILSLQSSKQSTNSITWKRYTELTRAMQ